jgi:hypothetical protein
MGRRQCELAGCTKGVAGGGTPYCKAHGGGKRCQEEGCTKSAAPEGSTGHLIWNGMILTICSNRLLQGARLRQTLCQHEGCLTAARGGTPHCIAHGGGKRCQHADCLKSAEGATVYCKAHGGVKRCQEEGCFKSARGDTGACISPGALKAQYSVR